MTKLSISLADNIHTINAKDWDALTDGSPLTSHAFLSALETASCVGEETGWQPCPLIVTKNQTLIGAMPLYVKSHSYGEYVFDWSWADAYARNGMHYYPKLVSTIPFTPITGARVFSHQPEIRSIMLETLVELLNQHQFSSAHILFTDEQSTESLANANWLMRSGVQFRWENKNYSSFENFLSTLAHDKRKKIQQDRKKTQQAGVICKRLTGQDIQAEHWDFFFECYQNTYFEHHSTPYLTREFFHTIGNIMSKQLLLIIAEIAGKPIAAALNIYGTDYGGHSTLYGRYWGALAFIPSLHFELCYYQAQEFCIERQINFFEGGAQGEHKLARGFKPRPTKSFHKIAHPEFSSAIEHFIAQESVSISHYQHELEERVPFKGEPTK